MKELAGVLAAFLLLLGVAAFAVEVLDDRQTVVPPPDAVAEMFTRSVMAGRWKPARDQLLDPESRSVRELEALRAGLGERLNVEAETLTHDGTRAVVVVRVPSRNVVKNYALRFEEGWKIE